MIVQNFDLNLIPDSAPVIVHCDQYDYGTGRLVATLYDGANLYTPTGNAIIQGIKPDMHGFAYNATLSGSTVTADLTEQMTAVDGTVYCQFVITESTGRTGTFVFVLSVQRSALPDDTDLSESDYQLIEQAIESSEDSEAWAVGERDGVPVPSTDPTYHNNSKYWAQIASQQGGIPVYYVQASATPTSSDPFVIPGIDFSKVFKLVVSTQSTTVVNLGSIYLSDGTNTKRYYAYSKRTDGTGVTNVTDYMRICYGSASYCNALEFLCQSNKDNTYLAIYAGDDNVPKYLGDLSNVTLTSPTAGQGLVYDAVNSEWINGALEHVFIGASDSAGYTTTKVVTCPDFTAADLTEGIMLLVMFTNANTTTPISLNVNSTGDVQLVNYSYMQWASTSGVLFVYHNSKWWVAGLRYSNGTSSNYGVVKLSDSVSGATGQGIAATPAAVKTAYDLANTQSDWSQSDNTQVDFIKNKPTIPSAQVNSDWNAASGVAQILNKPTLATVATSGSYSDLSNKPTIPDEISELAM